MKEGAYYVDGYSINKTEFGERIKSAREELKMTQTQLAQLLKTSQTTVAKYEHGEQIPRADVLAAISKATGKSADWLLFGNDTTNNSDDITAKQWIRYFLQLLKHPQEVAGFVETPYGDTQNTTLISIELLNNVDCKDGLGKWQFFGNDAASVSFHGREMAAFFRKLAAIETVKDMLPPEQLQLLEENAIDAGAEIFQPEILVSTGDCNAKQ